MKHEKVKKAMGDGGNKNTAENAQGNDRVSFIGARESYCSETGADAGKKEMRARTHDNARQNDFGPENQVILNILE